MSLRGDEIPRLRFGTGSAISSLVSLRGDEGDEAIWEVIMRLPRTFQVLAMTGDEVLAKTKREVLAMTKSEGFAMKKRGGGACPRPDKSM